MPRRTSIPRKLKYEAAPANRTTARFSAKLMTNGKRNLADRILRQALARAEAQANAYVQEMIAASPADGADKPYREYLETRRNIDALRRECDAHVDSIYRINKPVPRAYALRKEP